MATRDLGDTPLSIVPYSRLEHYPEKNLCAGFTNPSLDLFVKDHISDWRGRGPCIVIDELPLRLRRFDYDLDFVAVALHELAHILQRDVLYRERPNVTPEVIQAESDRLALLVSNEAALLHKNLANPLTDHNGEYLRIAFHLHHRAVAIGQPLAANMIIDTTAYGLSASECYADAIAEEADRMRDTSLDRAVLTEIADVSRRATDASKRRSELEDEIRSLRSWSESDAVGAEQAPYPGHAEELRERSVQRKQRADSLQPKLAEVETTVADLRQRELSLRERLLQP